MTIEGELLPFHQQELKVGGDGEEDRIFFIWPTTIVHKITPGSPLYMLSAADFLQEKFEIVVVLEGDDHILLFYFFFKQNPSIPCFLFGQIPILCTVPLILIKDDKNSV